MVAAHAGAEFGALGSFHDNLVAFLDADALGIKKISFTAAAEADADNFCQNVYLLLNVWVSGGVCTGKKRCSFRSAPCLLTGRQMRTQSATEYDVSCAGEHIPLRAVEN